ncbi:DNA primase [Alicyclobacillus herbarius]|uniref:DNA primase n=1 Tax=Alicyclobacillus herbarius TaxID=122960 RepID=UPI000403E53F|nr:DNA primase [Alicyclobacillus herbarius]
MSRIPDSFVEEIRRRVDIVDVISEHVQLRRSGRSFVGLCPFHNERTPSFSVSPDRQLYHCFGCGAGGTVIRFVMDMEGLDFQEAVVALARRANLPLPFEPDSSETVSSQKNRREAMYQAHDLAAKLYNYILMNTSAGVQALSYLEGRKISRKSAMDFRLGFAPADGKTLYSFLRRRGFTDRLLVDAGLVVELGGRMVDRFRDRLMIPIQDGQGRVVAFGGRVLSPDGKPKYLNSPETEIFHKGRLLFNLYAARRAIRQTDRAVLMEGNLDVVSAWQAGVENAVASLGTSFTLEQAGRLKRMTNRLVIAYDGDSAGTSAAVRAMEIAEEAGLEVRIAVFPKGVDPDEFIRQEGPSAFRQLIFHQAMSAVEFLISRLRAEADLSQVAGRTDFLHKALQVLWERASPIERDTHLRSLAQEFHVSREALEEELASIGKRLRPKRRHAPAAKVHEQTPRRSLEPGYVLAGRRLLQAALTDDKARQLLMDEGVDELATPEQTALLAFIYAFFATHSSGDVQSFLDSLDDPDLIRFASSLLVEDIPEMDASEMMGYLRTVRLNTLEAAWRQALIDSGYAQVRGDAIQAQTLRQKAETLQQEIQRLKRPLLG